MIKNSPWKTVSPKLSSMKKTDLTEYKSRTYKIPQNQNKSKNCLLQVLFRKKAYLANF